MSAGPLPEINALVELSVLGGGSYRSRVENASGDRLMIAAPMNVMIADLPETGARLTVRWAAGARGRYAVPARMAEVCRDTVATWAVTVTGPPQIEQNRRFVRGGGGEPIRIRRTVSGDDPASDGRVMDVSERSVRGRFDAVDIRAGDPAEARFLLDDDVIEVTGTVLRVIEHDTPKAAEVVIVYEPDESQATAVRRYVLRQQMLARARGG